MNTWLNLKKNKKSVIYLTEKIYSFTELIVRFTDYFSSAKPNILTWMCLKYMVKKILLKNKDENDSGYHIHFFSAWFKG